MLGLLPAPTALVDDDCADAVKDRAKKQAIAAPWHTRFRMKGGEAAWSTSTCEAYSRRHAFTA
jgi:hypothetical protein